MRRLAEQRSIAGITCWLSVVCQWTILCVFWVCVCVCTYSLSVPSSLKAGPIGCLETSVINVQATLHSIPEERRLHLCGGENLKFLLCVFLSIPILFYFSIIVFVVPSPMLPSFGNRIVESGRFPFFSNDSFTLLAVSVCLFSHNYKFSFFLLSECLRWYNVM